MKHAIELEMEEHKHSSARVRNKRNIFGSIISSLTGLATGREALTPIKTMDLKKLTYDKLNMEVKLFDGREGTLFYVNR